MMTKRKENCIIKCVAVDWRCLNCHLRRVQASYRESLHISSKTRHEYFVCCRTTFVDRFILFVCYTCSYSHRHRVWKSESLSLTYKLTAICEDQIWVVRRKWNNWDLSLHSMNCFEKYRTRVDVDRLDWESSHVLNDVFLFLSLRESAVFVRVWIRLRYRGERFRSRISSKVMHERRRDSHRSHDLSLTLWCWLVRGFLGSPNK